MSKKNVIYSICSHEFIESKLSSKLKVKQCKNCGTLSVNKVNFIINETLTKYFFIF